MSLNEIRSACKNKDKNKVKSIIQQDKRVVNKSDEFGAPLHAASFNGSVAIVELLLDEGANLKALGKRGCSALHFAAGAGHTNVLKCLLKRGTEINLQDNIGFTALHTASYGGHMESVKLLATYPECDLDLRDYRGKTALDVAREENKHNVADYLSKIKKNQEDSVLEQEVVALRTEMQKIKMKQKWNEKNVPDNIGVLTDKILLRIAKKISEEQTSLGAELDMDLHLVKQIQRDNRDSTCDATLNILTTWRENNTDMSDNAKVTKLKSALIEIERQDLVLYLDELIK